MEPEHAAPSRVSPRPRRPVLPPADPAVLHTYRTDLAKVRALVIEQARAAGLTESRANDLVLAVSEVAANTLRHTASSGTLTIWHDRDEIVCEIRDEGEITDPLAGQRRPAADATGGHGLWLVHQVCDLVELSSDATGTTIRMQMGIQPPGLSADQRPPTGGSARASAP
jgi:anti-sigma regulatory factor (Ser/Thr protein kinase)